MKKILGYLKPYLVLIGIVTALIFIQAIGNLKLPDYMADIVNVGIQSNGIEDITPKAISQESFLMLKNLMTEEDKEVIESSYILLISGSDNDNSKKYIEQYPLLKSSNIYVLDENVINDREKMAKLDSIFMVTDKVAMDLLLKQQTSMTSEEIVNSINNAKKMEETMLSQIAVNATKALYTELGMEISDIQTKYMIKVGAAMIITTLVIIISSITVGYFASRIAAGVARNLRKDIFEKVQRFSDREFDKMSTASLITRTTNDVTQIQSLIYLIIRIVLFALLTMVGAIIMITRTASSMLWVLVLGIVLIIVLVGIMLSISIPKFKIFQSLIDKLNLISRENLNGIMVIRAFGTQKYEEKRFDKANFELANTLFFVNKIIAFMMPAMTIIMNLLIILIVWVGAEGIANSELQVGNMMAAIQYTMQVLISFLMISMLFIMIPRAVVSIKRILEVLNTEISINDTETPADFVNDKVGYVEFRNVAFKYENADENVLENISFVAKPGETTAIVGATGSGKTTIVKLIPRFYDVTEGEVLVNGVNVKDVPQFNLHEQIGYIPQKASLLSGTIESNLKYGNENISDEVMEKCVKVAQAKGFIDEKEDKYQGAISQSGANISGGQKQRLSIARALIKGAPIYIFDDSFSALDFKTDANLRQELKENFKDATKIIVAQRINTIMEAEQIIVLEEGKIVGIGTHQELMESCKTYREIADSQLGNDGK